MKKVLSTIAFLLCLVTIAGMSTACGKNSKEDIVFTVVCYVAEEYDIEPNEITIQSGSVREDESNDEYDLWICVSVDGYTLCFNGSYKPETEKITYKRMSGNLGPLFYDTDDFDIKEVNNKLKRA